MKTTLFILYFLFFGFIGYSQLNTKIIEIDLGTPHKQSIRICDDADCEPVNKSRWLSVRSKDMVSIKLIHGNPKYTYKINTKSFSFFNVEAEVSQAIKEAKANSNEKSNDTERLMTIDDISKKNKDLNNEINSFDKKSDGLRNGKSLENKASVLELAKEKYSLNYTLLTQLEKFKDNPKKDNPKYELVKKELVETKDKAKQNIKEVIQYFGTVDSETYTLPIDLQGKNIDTWEFKLHRFDKETKEEDLTFAPNPYNIWIKGGLKIDVSAGIFFTSLYDSEYDKRDDSTTAGNKIIMLKNSGDYDMAFGSTINTYVRMNSWIVPTLNFGAVITQNEKLQVLLGGGVILGKQERIIFSAGISMGKVDRIADGYQVGGSYNLGDSGNIPTQSQFKFGKFFGITYNLSKVKKISLDKGIEQN